MTPFSGTSVCQRLKYNDATLLLQVGKWMGMFSDLILTNSLDCIAFLRASWEHIDAVAVIFANSIEFLYRSVGKVSIWFYHEL